MLDIKLIREKSEWVRKAVESKGYKAPIEEILRLDEERRDLQKKLDDLSAKKNKASKQIAALRAEEKQAVIGEMKKLDREFDEFKEQHDRIAEKFDVLMSALPNVPAPDVKVGKDESKNEVIRTVGRIPKFAFEAKDHLALGQILDILDTERAAKVSGSRFGYIKNQAVVLEFALIHFVFDLLQRKDFRLILPPVMVKSAAMKETGHLMPGEEKERYYYPEDDLYLVGTSEQSVVPMHKNEVFETKNLPLRYASFSTCFRREAGSYGKDVRGILRVHQFDKVEMVSFTRPEDSDFEHEFLLSIEEEIMNALRLPYRVVKMCTGDLGASAARKYDIEVWLPAQKIYRETHSTSNCTDFQARRLHVRYRNKNQLDFVHTLNGTAIAVGRMLVAIFENYQAKDGSIGVPKVLQKYCRFKKISYK